jgi:hypothetical protein
MESYADRPTAEFGFEITKSDGTTIKEFYIVAHSAGCVPDSPQTSGLPDKRACQHKFSDECQPRCPPQG